VANTPPNSPNPEEQFNLLREEYEKFKKELGEIPVKFDFKSQEAKQQIEILKVLVKDLTDRIHITSAEASGLASIFRDNIESIGKYNEGINLASSSFRGLSSIASKLSLTQQGLQELSEKELGSLKKKAEQYKENLSISKNILEHKIEEIDSQKKILEQEIKKLDASKSIEASSVKERKEKLADLDKLNKHYNQNINALTSVNAILKENDESYNFLITSLENQNNLISEQKKLLGVVGAVTGGIVDGMKTLGLSKFTSILGLEDAIKNAHEESLKLSQAFTIIGRAQLNENIKQLDGLLNKANGELDTNKRLLQEIQDIGGDKQMEAQLGAEIAEQESKINKLLQDRTKIQNTLDIKETSTFGTENLKITKKLISDIGNNFKELITDPAAISSLFMKEIVSALISGDKLTGQLAKNFGISYAQSSLLREELNSIANLSGDSYINTKELQLSLEAISKSLGTNVMLGQQMLVDYTKLTTQAGYSQEAANKMALISLNTGQTLEGITSEYLGQVSILNTQNKLSINEKELLESIKGISSATALSLGLQADEIGRAAFEAKKLGLTLQQVESISSSLVGFESSIKSELEAEVLTGKQLNLERARYYALTNNVAELAKEIGRQGITAEKFGNMNRIQQESIAKALGMQKEELAASLMESEGLRKLGVRDAEAARKKVDNLVQTLGYEKALLQIGNDKYGQQLASESIQQRYNKSIEKLREIFVSIAQPILSILDPLVKIAVNLLPVINIVLSPITYMFKIVGESLAVAGHWISMITDGLKDVGTWLNKNLGFMNGFSKMFEDLHPVVSSIGNTLKGVLGSMILMGAAVKIYSLPMFKGYITGLMSVVSWLYKASGAQLLFNKVRSMFGGGVTAAAATASGTTPVTPSTTPGATPTTSPIPNATTANASKSISTLQKLQKTIVDINKMIGAAFNSFIKTISSIVKNIIKETGSIVNSLIGSIQSILIKSLNLLKGIGTKIVDVISSIGSSVIKGIKGIINEFPSLFKSVEKTILQLLSSLENIGSKLIEFISSIGGELLESGMELISNLAKGVLGLGETIVEGLGKIVKKLPPIAKALGKTIVSFFQPMAALANPVLILGIAVFTGAMLGLGAALLMAGKGIEFAGRGIKSILEGIGTVVEKLATGLVKIIETTTKSLISLSALDTKQLFLLGPALVSAAVGFTAFSLAMAGGGIISGISKFLTGDPLKPLFKLATISKPLQTVSLSIRNISNSIIQFTRVLSTLDTKQLFLLGPALVNISKGFKAFTSSINGGGIISRISKFLTGDPLKPLFKLAAAAKPLQTVSLSIRNISNSIVQLNKALKDLDVNKINSIKINSRIAKPDNVQSNRNRLGNLNYINQPTTESKREINPIIKSESITLNNINKRIISNNKETKSTETKNTEKTIVSENKEIINLLKELIVAVKSEGDVLLDGYKVGKALRVGSYKTG
jgi:hypothetical protein